MEFLTVFAVAVALGTDASSLAVGIGMQGISHRQVYTFSGLIGIFHIVMPLGGFFLGRIIGEFLGGIAILIGAFLIIVIGINMIREIYKDTGESSIINFNNIKDIFLMALCVSVDAFSVGFGLGTFSAYSIPLTVGIFGLTAAAMTVVGLVFGERIGGIIGEKSQWVGGLILIGIGIRIILG
jgi:putative Mn2+ efflux pump MntP